MSVFGKNFAIVKLSEPDDAEFPYLIAAEIVVDGCEQNEYLTVKSFADTNDYIAFSHSDLLELKKLIEHVTKEP